MKNIKFLQPKSNIFTVYVLIFCLFLVASIYSYRIWEKLRNISNSATIEETSPAPVSNNLVNSEAESLEANSMHPEFIINDGDTLGSILDEAGISNIEAASIVNSFAKRHNPRKLNVGTVIELTLEKDQFENNILNTMTVTISNSKKIQVTRFKDGFKASEILVPLIRKVEKKVGVIKNNFTATALELSIPANAIMGMIRAFSYDVDFQRDIKRGDKLEVVMDKFYTEDGKLSHSGEVLFSSLTINGKKVSIYQFAHKDGNIAYYNEKGENIKKEFLRTPINAARISSKYGMRQHPVHGYSKMHRGIDFAAPTGTPILAAGSGTIEIVNNYYGNYGKYIRIKHNSTYSTVYAHASRFANGIKPGVKVSQGQVVAYVGTTGATTGPHLHYELIESGKQINPMKFKFASSSERLTGRTLEQFIENKKKIEKLLKS